jgi:hypothetical protein
VSAFGSIEQRKAMSGAEKKNDASAVRIIPAELRGTHYVSSSSSTGVNPLDNVNDGVRWMMKGQVDSTGFAKHFPHTARDLRDVKVSLEQLAEGLGSLYNHVSVTLVDDSQGSEISVCLRSWLFGSQWRHFPVAGLMEVSNDSRKHPFNSVLILKRT